MIRALGRWLSGMSLAISAGAQVRLDPANADGRSAIEAFEKLWVRAEGPSMPCRVQPLEPRMGFSFRFWSGFQISINLADFPPEAVRIGVVFRVRARGKTGLGPPTYFYDVAQLPEAAKRPKGQATWGGGFYLGPGEYAVEWLAGDAARRLCKNEWKVEAKGRAKDFALKPGTVEAVGLESWRGMTRKTNGSERRVTIFLHAAPRWRGRSFVKLSGWDRTLLLSSLTALLDLGGFTSARVVAFDSLGRRVIFRSDNFDPQAYANLARVLRESGFGTVDFGVLTQGKDESKFLASLVDEDRKAQRPSDVVVFLGPELRSTGRLSETLSGAAEKLPRTYYLALARDVVLQGDLISKMVKAAGGKTYLVLRGRDLLKPIRAVAQDK